MDKLHALAVLARLSERRPETANHLAQAVAERPDLLISCLEVAEAESLRGLDAILARIVSSWPLAQACSFHNRLPEHTTSLRETGLAVTLACWRFLEQRLDEAPVPDRTRSEIGNNLVARLAELGRYAEAAVRAEGLVAYFRPLTSGSHERTLFLTRSLASHAMAMAGMGRVADAVAAYDEAAGILRGIEGQADPEVDLELGSVLNNLAGQYLAGGQPDKAIASARESVAMHRRYHDRDPGPEREPRRNRANLAAALGVLANALVVGEDYGAAHAAAVEAEAILDVLKEDSPSRFRHQWAMALNNLAMTAQRLGRMDEALVALQRAAEVYKQMATAYPEAFLPACAAVHRNLVIGMYRSGDWDGALAASAAGFDYAIRIPLRDEPAGKGPAEEALSLYLQLEPYKHLGGAGLESLGAMLPALLDHAGERLLALVDTLIETARGLKETGRPEEAMALLRAAAQGARPIADRGENDDAQTLVSSALVLILSIQATFPRPETTDDTVDEATSRLTALARGGERAQGNAALLFNNLSNALSWFDRRDQALAAAGLAVDHLLPLVAADAARFEPELAVALYNLARRLQTNGRKDEAAMAASEARRILAPYAAANPEQYRAWMTEIGDLDR